MKMNPSQQHTLSGSLENPDSAKLKIIHKLHLCLDVRHAEIALLTLGVPCVPIRYGFSMIYLFCLHVMLI